MHKEKHVSEAQPHAVNTDPPHSHIARARCGFRTETGLPGFPTSDRRNGAFEVFRAQRWQALTGPIRCLLCFEGGPLLTDGTRFAHQGCSRTLGALFLDPLETLAEPPETRFPSEAEMVERACATLETTDIGLLLNEACDQFGIYEDPGALLCTLVG